MKLPLECPAPLYFQSPALTLTTDSDCFFHDSANKWLGLLSRGENPMTYDPYLGGLIALALAVYLGYAMFNPEKF